MDKISATLNVKFGSKQLFSGTLPDLPVDSLDSPVQFMVPAAAGTAPGTKTITINQGGAGDPVVFVLIASDTYGGNISYQLGTPAAPAPAPAPAPATTKPAAAAKPASAPEAKPTVPHPHTPGWTAQTDYPASDYEDVDVPDHPHAAPAVAAAPAAPAPAPAAPTPTSYSLDYPHIFLGPGAVKLLSDNPTSWTFQNGTNAAVTITIHIGRMTPTPPAAAVAPSAVPAVKAPAAPVPGAAPGAGPAPGAGTPTGGGAAAGTTTTTPSGNAPAAPSTTPTTATGATNAATGPAPPATH